MREAVIHVVLDTNIFREDPKRQKPPFKPIEQLMAAEVLALHVPYVVEREFQTQQRKKYETEFRNVLSGLKEIAHLSPDAASTPLKEIPSWYDQL